MKFRIAFPLLLVLVVNNLLSQTPQGFTYQALAMNSSGQPIRDQALPVRITIQSDSLGGTIFWQELHSTVTTNSSGFFSIILGKGTRLDGIAPTFADINWSVTPKFIKTEIDWGGWKQMGSSRLWSVPYAMTAGDLTGSLKKLEVAGTTTSLDEALFEVRNKNGQTVFAVYNEGVRINVGDGENKAVKGGFAIGSFNETKQDPLDLFVVNRDSVRVYIYDDPLNKAVKGGFAIGGFHETKGVTNDYLLISPDSIRMYIDKNTSKAVKGGFAIGSFNETKATGQDYLRVTNDSVRIYIDSDVNKAVKGGFAIGSFNETKAPGQEFLVVSRDSVRIYIDDQAKAVKGGFAIGGFHESKAGAKSFLDVATVAGGIINPSENRILWYPLKNAFLAGRVLIENSDSIGENSFASGFESKSAGIYSQALGFKAIARGDFSTAVGKNALAGKENSFAFGDGVIANGVNSYAFGRGAMATTDGSYAFGFNALASGQDALAFGTGTQATGNGSFALGFIGRDSAGLATTNTKASGDWSFAIGMGSQSVNTGAITLGTMCNANGQFAFASGYQSVASGNYSIAMGSNAKATNDYAVAIGIMASASNSGDVALGHGKASGGGSAAINYGEATNHASFASNASKATGRYSTSTGYGNQASGDASVNLGGAGSLAAGYCSATLGYNNIARGFYSTSMGFNNSSPGYMSVATGNNTISRSYATLVVGRFNDTTNMSSTSGWVLTDPVFVVGSGSSNSLRKNAFTVLKNGKVGIGVINPYYNMTVVGDAEKGVLLVSPNYDDQSNGNSEIILAEDYWGNYRMKIQYNGNENKLHFVGGYASTDYLPQYMTINRHGGYIGIGNPNPTVRLHVQGTTKSVTPTGTAAAAGQFQAWTEGTAQGQQAVYSLYPTFQGTADNGPRRAADIVGGFNAGAWGTEYISFNVGRSGSANDAQTVTIERMRITGNGNIGIGTANPGAYRLYVNGSAYSTGGWSGSDIRWKKDIIEVVNVIGDIVKLRPVNYNWKIEDFPEVGFESDQQIGLIAQEVEILFPELVRTGVDGYKSISYEKLSVILIQGIKEQQKQIELAVAENNSLRAELKALEERLSAIEYLISNK